MNDQAVIPKEPSALTKISSDILSSIVLRGDISELNPQQRVVYYNSMCERLGLDPVTQPFQILKLSGKEVLYASKSCTEQLRKRDNISVVPPIETQKVDDVWIVKITVKNTEGRTDASTGAVPITNLKGEALANALMKAETKAKRRATLSICGLGMLDETEIETIPGAIGVHHESGEVLIESHAGHEQSEHHQPTNGTVEFDPTKERLTFGKYGPNNGSEGMLWSEVPEDYIAWLLKQADSKHKAKAEATMRWRQMQQMKAEGSGSVVDEMFPPETNIPAELPKPESKSDPSGGFPNEFEILQSELDDVARTRVVAQIKKWGTDNSQRIQTTCSEREREILKKMYTNAIDQAKKIRQDSPLPEGGKK